MLFLHRSDVTLNSVRREIVSTLKIVCYDKVRGRNKAQRWLRSVCVRFFIPNITQPDTISQDTIMSYTYTFVYANQTFKRDFIFRRRTIIAIFECNHVGSVTLQWNTCLVSLNEGEIPIFISLGNISISRASIWKK
jgi:hypothetical protein